MTKSSTPPLARFDEPASSLPACPKCLKNNAVIRSGLRKTMRKGEVQRYLCNACGKIFTVSLKRTAYPPKVMAAALTYYNKGHTFGETSTYLKREMKTNVPLQTVQSWARRYKDLATFIPLRKRYDIDPRTTIQIKKLYHQQVYEFKYHQLKTNIAAKTYPRIRDYLRVVAASETRINGPDRSLGKMFESSMTRCSSFRPPNPIPAQVRRIPANNATKMAELAVTMAKSRAARHEAVEDFFIANDSTTFAVEVPVYIMPEEAPQLNLKEPLTGHIDIIQFRNNKVFILDYKPDQDPASSSTQLQLYRLALSIRTGIPISNIATAAFNEQGYAEFQN